MFGLTRRVIGACHGNTIKNCTLLNNVSYENWAAFAAANPTYRIAKDRLTFIIVDARGTFDITNVQLGKATAHARCSI